MKQPSKFSFIISIFLLCYAVANAQSIPDSTMQKINGERAFYETLGKIYPADSTVSVNETNIAGVKSYWFNEKLLDQKQIIIYLHGGVYVMGSINVYRAMLSHLAKSLNTAVLYVEYSLAPEHPFPAANNEILKVYVELLKKYPNFKITIIGDSAGGGLAVTLVHNIQASNLALPNSLALISPWIDLNCTNESYVTKQAVDPILSRKFLYEHALLYAPDKIKEANPAELKFKKFPPVFLLVGTDEVLNDDAKRFYAVIKPIQQQSKLKEFSGQKHVWLFSHIDAEASIAAISDIKAFISVNRR